MPANLLHVLGLIAVPVVIAIVAAAASVKASPGPKLMSAVQHFAAGVVIAAVAGEVLPSLREEGHLWYAVVGFLLGTALVVILEYVGEREGAAEGEEATEGATVASVAKAALPIGMLIPVAVDLLMDGMLIGLGASLGPTQALILTIALTIEVLFLGISLSASLRKAGQSTVASIGWTAAVALMMLVGAVGGVIVLGDASPQLLAAVLAFGAAALLYLAVEELMIEAHENAETPWLTSLFFVGFSVIYVLGAVAE